MHLAVTDRVIAGEQMVVVVPVYLSDDIDPQLLLLYAITGYAQFGRQERRHLLIQPAEHLFLCLLQTVFQHDMHYDYFPGAIELLEELKSKDIACCIVTSSDKRKMESLYRQHPDFPSHFQAIVTGNMVSEPKPSPECFLLGAKMLRIDIKDCVVIEDSINGLKAGMASGAHVIGLYTTCSREVISPHCHMVAPTIGNITAQSILNIINL